MSKAINPFSMIPTQVKPKCADDTPERFALRTRHLRVNGNPVESTLFRLQSERDSDPLRSAA